MVAGRGGAAGEGGEGVGGGEEEGGAQAVVGVDPGGCEGHVLPRLVLSWWKESAVEVVRCLRVDVTKGLTSRRRSALVYLHFARFRHFKLWLFA